MSRGLDAQVARDVFGWTDIRLREDVGAVGIPPRDEDGHTVPFWVEKCYFYIVPEYSSELSLADLVIEKMFDWRGTAGEEFTQWFANTDPLNWTSEDWAHRICMQALLAISLERMEGNDGK